MSKVKHTQGPWKKFSTPEDEHQTIFIASETYGAICQIPHRLKGKPEIINEHEKNAQLIVAAPDLLEALTKVIEETEAYTPRKVTDQHHWNKAKEMAKKANEKALL